MDGNLEISTFTMTQWVGSLGGADNGAQSTRGKETQVLGHACHQDNVCQILPFIFCCSDHDGTPPILPNWELSFLCEFLSKWKFPKLLGIYFEGSRSVWEFFNR